MNQRRLRTGVADRVFQRSEDICCIGNHQVAHTDSTLTKVRRLRNDHL